MAHKTIPMIAFDVIFIIYICDISQCIACVVKESAHPRGSISQLMNATQIQGDHECSTNPRGS